MYPLGYVSKTPLPGLDIALGVTSYQIADTVRRATKAAATGRDVTARVVVGVERSVDQLRAGTTLVSEQVAELARHAARGTVHAALEVPAETRDIVAHAVRGIFRSLHRSKHDTTSAAYGAVAGIREATVDSGIETKDLVRAVAELVEEDSTLSASESAGIVDALNRALGEGSAEGGTEQPGRGPAE
jgi:hypothetical protein